jgi:uncharacterized radical SAM superfamily protein
MILKTYSPGPRFPAISLSGTACELHCAHCNATYLEGMLKADTPEALRLLCQQLQVKGAIGVLLSGGSDKHGRILNLESMLPTIRQIKAETNLIVNIHPGLVSEEMAKNLSVDFASLEIPSDETVGDVFNLPLGREEYIATYHRLNRAGIRVVPHVNVFNGTEHQLLQGIPTPETIVVIVFSPTKGTHRANEPSPSPEMVELVVRGIKNLYPTSEISLGCMRTRERTLRHAIELAALKSGATRMELPSRTTLKQAAALGFSSIINYDACCALPRIYEARARTPK